MCDAICSSCGKVMLLEYIGDYYEQYSCNNLLCPAYRVHLSTTPRGRCKSISLLSGFSTMTFQGDIRDWWRKKLNE